MSDLCQLSSGSFALYGVGQLGRLFGAGLLALGHPVIPLRRSTSASERDAVLAQVDRVLVAVGEEDLSSVLMTLPAELREGRTWLLQNELLPTTWRDAGLTDPTVLVVWSEKKKGRALAVVGETLVAGPDRDLAVHALTEVDVPCRAIGDDALDDALVDKNLYILVSNFAGLRVGGTVSDLLSTHRALATQIAREVLAIEGARLGRSLAVEPFLERLWAAFAKDPAHGCRGRTAEARLVRALGHAARAGLLAPTLAGLSTT